MSKRRYTDFNVPLPKHLAYCLDTDWRLDLFQAELTRVANFPPEVATLCVEWACGSETIEEIDSVEGQMYFDRDTIDCVQGSFAQYSIRRVDNLAVEFKLYCRMPNFQKPVPFRSQYPCILEYARWNANDQILAYDGNGVTLHFYVVYGVRTVSFLVKDATRTDVISVRFTISEEIFEHILSWTVERLVDRPVDRPVDRCSKVKPN